MSAVGSIFFYEFILNGFEIVGYFENSVKVGTLFVFTYKHAPGVQLQGTVGLLGSTKVRSLHLTVASWILM